MARWSGLACAGSSSSLAIFSRITVTRTILKNLQERSTYQSQSRILQQIPRRIIRCNRRLLLHCSVRQAISNTYALVLDGRGGAGGRGHRGGMRGRRGGGRGHNGNRKVKKSGDGNDGAEDDKQPAEGPMSYNCRGRGHFARDCTVKLCKRCHGKGHEENKCPSPADMKAHLTIELPNSDAGSTTSNVVAAVLSGGNFNGSSC